MTRKRSREVQRKLIRCIAGWERRVRLFETGTREYQQVAEILEWLRKQLRLHRELRRPYRG